MSAYTLAVHNPGRQTMPYFVFALDWGPVRSYSWSAPQQIHVLALFACFNYFRGVIRRYEGHAVYPCGGQYGDGGSGLEVRVRRTLDRKQQHQRQASEPHRVDGGRNR